MKPLPVASTALKEAADLGQSTQSLKLFSVSDNILHWFWVSDQHAFGMPRYSKRKSNTCLLTHHPLKIFIDHYSLSAVLSSWSTVLNSRSAVFNSRLQALLFYKPLAKRFATAKGPGPNETAYSRTISTCEGCRTLGVLKAPARAKGPNHLPVPKNRAQRGQHA